MKIIIGGGGLALEVADWAGYIDAVYAPVIKEDGAFEYSEKIQFNKFKSYLTKYECSLFLCSGKPSIKKKMHEEIKSVSSKLLDFPIIDRSFDKSNCVIGKGSIMMPNSFVSTLSSLSDFILINYGAVIGHNVKIGSYSSIGPNATIGGYCTLGECVYIGSGANIKEELNIGSNSIIGMGAVVLHDIPDNYVAVGNPAIAYSREEWEHAKSCKKRD